MTAVQPDFTAKLAPSLGLSFKQAVGRRRSVRFYKPFQAVEPEKVQRILEAARQQSCHGNAVQIRKAVVVRRNDTDPQVFDGLVDALYNQPQAAQAPVHIYWTIDLSGWDHLRSNLMKLLDVGALISSYGWSEQFIDDIVLNTPDFNVMAGERRFAEWLSAIEMGLAMGSALLAAQDEGLGTQLLTGKRNSWQNCSASPTARPWRRSSCWATPPRDPKPVDNVRVPTSRTFITRANGAGRCNQIRTSQPSSSTPKRSRLLHHCRTGGRSCERWQRCSRFRTDTMPTPEFLDQQSVRRYASTLSDLTPRERDQRLDLLEAFAARVDRQPDAMIADIFDETTRKYKRRRYYTTHAKEFAAELGGSPNAQLQRSNLIRAFFIANGRRLLTERPAWMSDSGT